MYNSAELTAYELAHLRLIDEARRAQLEQQLGWIIEDRQGGRRGYWMPEDQGFTRSFRKAVSAWVKYSYA